MEVENPIAITIIVIIITALLEGIIETVTHRKNIIDHRDIKIEDIKILDHHPLLIVERKEIRAIKKIITREVMTISEKVNVMTLEIEITDTNILEEINIMVVNAHLIDQGNMIKL